MSNISSKIFTKKETKYIIKTNILKMLISRKLLDNDLEKYHKIIKKYSDLSYFELELLNKDSLYVMFIDIKITSLKKIDNIEDIINNNKKKIFIVNDIQNKIWEVLIANNIEVFKHSYFFRNIIDHDLVPKHELLVDKDKEEFLHIYNKELHNMPFILQSDPIVRYYNAKINDIFRITRLSPTTGNSTFYRIVKKSSLPDT